MGTLHHPKSARHGRESSLREEQTFCRRAIESGVYDSMSDQEWVAVCEKVATEARQAVERHDAASPGEATAYHSAVHTPEATKPGGK